MIVQDNFFLKFEITFLCSGGLLTTHLASLVFIKVFLLIELVLVVE